MVHIPVGADLNRFYPRQPSKVSYHEWGLDPGKLTILYLGQLEGAAHAGRLVEAAAPIYKKNPNIQFVFAGGGEQLDDLKQRAAASAAAQAIHILGYVPYEKIPGLIAAADVCVACFDNNAATRAKSPLKIAEYLAAGKPIVASDVGEVRWMLQNTGIVVQPDSTSALAEGILAYANDPERRMQDARQARSRAEEQFSWEHGAQTLLSAYQIAINNHS
jgi:glycosyltransferase involved in cell wall biosynthesis